MLLDLKMDGKYVVVIGGGSEGYRKTLDFLESGAKIRVVSKTFSSGIQRLMQSGRITVQKASVENAETYVRNLKPKPDLLVAVTSNPELNANLIRYAKSSGCTVYAPDNPSISDFTLPALAKIGDVKVAISTTGRSPAMASVLRQRIEKMITQEDLLQVKLQNQLRRNLKQQISDQKTRRKLLYEILENSRVKRLLKKGEFDKAQELAMKILEKSCTNKTSDFTAKQKTKRCTK